MTSGDTEQFERIVPVARQAETTRLPEVAASHGRRLWWWIVAVGFLSIAAMTTLVYLPQWLSKPGTRASAIDSARTRLQDQATQAESLRQDLYERWLKLEAMDVSTWAGVRAERALKLLQEGEQLASEVDHLGALRALGASNELLTALTEQAPGIAADRREAGWLAYRRGDSQAAAEHFRVVLAIEPDDQEVRVALNRTAYLPQLLELSRRSRALESDGDLQGALTALREALIIDPENAEIEAEIERLNAAQAVAGFEAIMSRVYRAISAENYTAARQALGSAAALRPQSPEVRDAGIQIDVAVRAAKTESLRAQAAAMESREDWESAIGLYSELLQIDPALVLAQQGRDRARRLASLTTRAEALLESGEFSKDDVKRLAETLIEQIDTVKANAPSLQSLAEQLQQALYLSQQPVRVQLQSDNQTDIVVYRIGRLGAFENHELELIPGRYTVVGTRSGYRDVRAELVVKAGITPTPLLIRCEEQI